jgi:alanine dehydrogenase
MLIGVPKESVGIMPSTVRELTDRGHRVAVETRAGAGAGFADNDYRAAGAEIVLDADTIFGHAELIVKVKEPLDTERKNCLLGRCCSPIYI